MAKSYGIYQLIPALFGVCSVSFFISAEASSWSSPAYQTASVQTIKMTRSSRETSNSTKISTDKGPLSPGTHNLSLGVGQIFLMSKISNTEFDNAIGTELHYTYGVSELFSFESNFGYSSHSNGNLSMWHLAAGVRTNLAYFDQLVPFATLGLGFYDPSTTLQSGATLSGLLFGAQLGGGVELLLSDNVFFGTRLTFHNMFEASKKDSVGATQNLGGSYLSFLVHAGISF